jgi:hypothetical protein
MEMQPSNLEGPGGERDSKRPFATLSIGAAVYLQAMRARTSSSDEARL